MIPPAPHHHHHLKKAENGTHQRKTWYVDAFPMLSPHFQTYYISDSFLPAVLLLCCLWECCQEEEEEDGIQQAAPIRYQHTLTPKSQLPREAWQNRKWSYVSSAFHCIVVM